MPTRARAPVVLAAVALATACASSSGTARARASGASATAACAAHAALPAGIVSPGGILLFGEVHGVKEFPAFFGEAVCDVAASGAAVTAALELPGSEQAAVDAFLGSRGDEAAIRALTASPFWTREYQDGRSSEAVAALLVRLRELRASGLRVGVFLFDVEDPGPDRDARMAERLSGMLRSHPDAALMVLTGNLHARTAPGAPWDPQWRPTGWFLRQAGARVVSLDCRGPRGTAWICPSVSARECGAREVGASWGDWSGSGVKMLASPSSEGFAGLYFTASVTASAPAVPAPARR